MTKNTKWKIERDYLANYEKPTSFNNDEKFTITDDEKYGVLIYNISELRMGWYYGNYAIYANSKAKIPIVYAKREKRSIFYNGKYTFSYMPLSGCFSFSYSAYKEDALPEVRYPFLFIKPSEQQFAFLSWDISSIYYSFKEVEKDVIEFIENYPSEIERIEKESGHKRKTGTRVNLNRLIWHDIRHIDNAHEIYYTNWHK